MKQRADLTFKHNRDRGRHGWLRLTPAYSVRLVDEILGALPPEQKVIEPFCGTGTTGLVAAAGGHTCDQFDINPFLIWLANVKTRNYSESERHAVVETARAVVTNATVLAKSNQWVPPIKNVERWWSPDRLRMLSALYAAIHKHAEDIPHAARDLLLVAFCRSVMDWSNAAFNHQSMSFRDEEQPRLSADDKKAMLHGFEQAAQRMALDVSDRLPGKAKCRLSDSRALTAATGDYTALITSPPYPNRMSYIRELRPYMYWLGYLEDGREAGELDWQAIGGTWGIATSRALTWTAQGHYAEKHLLSKTVRQIAQQSPLLANYVHRYFEDMVIHFQAVARNMAKGGHVFYIVGNSKFYDHMLHVEELFADLMRGSDFVDVRIDKIRKRNSKKELFEYLVSGTYRAGKTPRFAFSDAPRQAPALLPFDAA